MEEPPSYHSVQVLNRSELIVDQKTIIQAVLACLKYRNAPPADVRILVTSDEEVAALNSRFRGVAEATDVLSFLDETQWSGDIAIAGPYAMRQSVAREIASQDELALLAIHGTLHLGGMDDEEEVDRLEMIRVMYEVAQTLGIERGEDWGSLLHEETVA